MFAEIEAIKEFPGIEKYLLEHPFDFQLMGVIYPYPPCWECISEGGQDRIRNQFETTRRLFIQNKIIPITLNHFKDLYPQWKDCVTEMGERLVPEDAFKLESKKEDRSLPEEIQLRIQKVCDAQDTHHFKLDYLLQEFEFKPKSEHVFFDVLCELHDRGYVIHHDNNPECTWEHLKACELPWEHITSRWDFVNVNHLDQY